MKRSRQLAFSALAGLALACQAHGAPLAEGQPKFLGCAYSPPQAPEFHDYWNKVTPENAGKWGSVEARRDVMVWSEPGRGVPVRQSPWAAVPDARAGLGKPAARRIEMLAAG